MQVTIIIIMIIIIISSALDSIFKLDCCGVLDSTVNGLFGPYSLELSDHV